MKAVLLLIAWLLCLASCGNSEITINKDDPAELNLDILVYDDGSGIVVVNASALNVTEFRFFMGDDSAPYNSVEGYYEYTYASSGSYLVEVRAYGSSGRYIKEDQRIVVPGENVVSVGEGYSTPFSYEDMDLVWNDEFSGSTLNSSYWSHDIGTGCPDLCGWGNNELEYYRPGNTIVGEGVVTIEARKEDFQGSSYTSGKIVTRNKFAAQYGRIDIRARLPIGQGIWPALWMLGTNQPTVGWPKCGEIDIMEMIGGSGRENRVSGNAFWDDNGVNDQPAAYILSEGIFADEYHVFSLIWDEQEICWLVDDQKFHNLDITTSDKSEFHNPFYIIFNVAVGGNWPGEPDASTVFPTEMKVDYIRVFEWN